MSERKVVIVIVTSITIAVVLFNGLAPPSRWAMHMRNIRKIGPVNFYGKVIDEQGRPMRDVNVTVGVDTANWAFAIGGDNPIETKTIRVRTDADGRFQVTNQRGWRLVVQQVAKPGYRFKPRIIGGGNWDVGFYFDPSSLRRELHRPDSDAPVTFTMITEEAYKEEQAKEARQRAEKSAWRRFEREQKRRKQSEVAN